MPKQKYNWELLKHEFLESDAMEVKWFFTDRWLIYNSDTATRTKGRSKEKKEHLKEITREALERNKEKSIEALEIPIETLKKAKMMAIWKIIKLINQGNLSVSDIVKWLASIKTELWEPDHIGANYNINQNKNDSLTQEELDALDVLFNMKWKHEKQ